MSATAGVIAPPPLIYGIPLLLGLLADRWHPWPLITERTTVPEGLILVLLGFVIRSVVVWTTGW